MQPFALPDFYVPWPARQNSGLESARVHSKAWAHEVGILGNDPQDINSPKIWDDKSFDRHDYALFCANIHPETSVQELELMTDWNVWAFYVDDYFLKVYKHSKDHDGARKYLERVLLFMPIELSPLPLPTNPTERGLADLWLRTAPSKPEAWRRRIIESTKSLLVESIMELDSMSQQRIANPIEYIEMRRRVGGALWSADLVEHAMFIEIPERIAAIRPMRVLKNTFADAVHLRNDIFSYEREVLKEGELTNAVLVLERFLNVDTQRAVNLVNDLLTSRLQQFEHTVITELEPLFEEYQLNVDERANVLTYIRGLQDWQSGAHEWHIHTSRYLNPDIEQDTSHSSFVIPNPTGIGTATLHITPATLGLKRLKNYAFTPYKKVGPIQPPRFYMPFKIMTNSHLETARQNSKLWARQMGMLDMLPGATGVFIWDEQRFDVTDIASFCAQAYPKVSASQLDLATWWIVWATYTDDYFPVIFGYPRDLAGAKILHARLLEFMPIDVNHPIPVPLNPVERGLADLWARTTKTMSVSDRSSFRKVVDGMIGSWVFILSEQIQNRIPDPVDYVETRRKTSGSDLVMFFPRFLHGQSIQSEIYCTRTMQELNSTAIDYVCLTNDIISYQREIEFEGELHNGVLVIENFLNCDLEQSVEIVNNLMTARIKQFEYIVKNELPVLLKDFNLDEKARRQLFSQIEALQNFMCASSRWHIATSRYIEHEFRRSLGPFTSSLTGLGTSAARTLELMSGEQGTGPKVSAKAHKMSSIIPKETKNFAVSHLKPPFAPKKEEAQTD